MTKYRIIKSIAKDPEAPYFIQEWDAKERLANLKEYEKRRATPAEVVWEDKDV